MKVILLNFPMKYSLNNCRRKVSTASASRGLDRFNAHELAFQPWFLPRASRLAINSLIPAGYRNKMRAYFDDYGCMICGKHELYDANGMCLACHHLIRRRLKTCVKRRTRDAAAERIDLIMGRRKALASKLLKRFSRTSGRMALIHRVNMASLRNPVDETLGFLSPGSWEGGWREFQGNFPEEQGDLGKSVRDLRSGRPSQ
jgi:hypothetical protein